MSTDSRFEQPPQQQYVEQQPNRFVEQAWGPQGRGVPQEFQRRHHHGGDTVNIYIDHANINMANGRPEFMGVDPHCQRQQDMRRIQYYEQDQYYRRDNYYCHRDRQWHRHDYRHHQPPPVYVRPPHVHVEPPQVIVRPPQVYVEPRYYEPVPRWQPPVVYSQPQNMDVYQDSVHGGRDGYTSSRTRIQTGNRYPTYDPYGYPTQGGRDDFDRMTDLGFGILDRVFANEANKRANRR